MRSGELRFVGYVCLLNMSGDIPWVGEVAAPICVIGRADESLEIQDFGVSIRAAQNAENRRWYEL
jgi:hypothetical protein